MPPGWEEIQLPWREIVTFAQFVKGYPGVRLIPFGESHIIEIEQVDRYALVDENADVIRVIRREYPENKPGSWCADGQFRDLLLPTAGGNQRGPTSRKRQGDQEHKLPSRTHICRMGNLDREQMKALAIEERRGWADSARIL